MALQIVWRTRDGFRSFFLYFPYFIIGFFDLPAINKVACDVCRGLPAARHVVQGLSKFQKAANSPQPKRRQIMFSFEVAAVRLV